MASTGATALADSIFAELVESRMVQELRPAMTSRSFVRFARKGPSQNASFPLWGDPGAAAALTDDLSEISNTALSDTQQTATAAGVGFRVDVTDFAREIWAGGNLYSEVGAMVGRSVSEKWETDLAALVDDFTNVTTAGGTATPTAFLSAVSALEQRDIPKPYVAYLDPKQSGEIRNELAFTTAVHEIGKGDRDVSFGNAGFAFPLYGVPIWQSSLVVTTSGQVGGGIFNSEDTLGGYIVIDQRLETQRDASYQAMEFIGSMWYGLVEISDTRGQGLDSTA